MHPRSLRRDASERVVENFDVFGGALAKLWQV